MESRLEIITPEKAAEYLSKNMPRNRNVSNSLVEKYARDMRTGKWELSPQGISFNASGGLIDGQHRLAAIIAAKVPVAIYVTRGVPNDVTSLDGGRVRSARDKAIMMYGDRAPSRRIMATATFMIEFFANPHRATDAEKIEFAIENADILHKAASIAETGRQHGCSTFCSRAQIVSVFVCELCRGTSEDVLRRFAGAVNSGFSHGESESAAIVLRNFLISLRSLLTVGRVGRAAPPHDIFSIAVQAVSDFSNGIVRKRSYKARECDKVAMANAMAQMGYGRYVKM